MEALWDALNLSYAYAEKKMEIHRLLRTYADSPHTIDIVHIDGQYAVACEALCLEGGILKIF